jgi:FixJ family two-component response regulator
MLRMLDNLCVPRTKIAVIDDDVVVQHSIGNLFKSAGYRCALYSSARAFFQVFDPPTVPSTSTYQDLQRQVNETGK